MSQTVIENPVINSPYFEPSRHFRSADDGITNDIIQGRRVSSYFIPIPQPKHTSKQMTITESEWVGDRIEENTFINQVRDQVKKLSKETGYNMTERDEVLSILKREDDAITVNIIIDRIFSLMQRRKPGKAQCIIVDEVDQYIAHDSKKLEDLRVFEEQLGKESHSRLKQKGSNFPGPFWVAVTYQEQLQKVIDNIEGNRVLFAKLLERFTEFDLTPSDIREVPTRRVLVKKTSLPQTNLSYKKTLTEIEEQEDLLTEINRFADNIQKVADLSLVPDLDDGVVLTASPLWEVIPRKDLAMYWKELALGKYEWSSIGKQLREKSLVKV